MRLRPGTAVRTSAGPVHPHRGRVILVTLCYKPPERTRVPSDVSIGSPGVRSVTPSMNEKWKGTRGRKEARRRKRELFITTGIRSFITATYQVRNLVVIWSSLRWRRRSSAALMRDSQVEAHRAVPRVAPFRPARCRCKGCIWHTYILYMHV